MFSGGIRVGATFGNADLGTEAAVCVPSSEFQTTLLYNAFEILHTNEKSGKDWKAYERTYTKNGRVFTLQAVKSFGHSAILKIFGDNANELARVGSNKCIGYLAITQAQKAKGDDVLIISALKAVTGRDFEVAVE